MSAKAVLFVHTSEGKLFAEVYTTDDGFEDPQLQCEAMKASVQDDFPDAIFSIGLNEEARQIMTRRRMRAMGFSDEELEDI